MRLAADAGERVGDVSLDSGELRHGLVYVGSSNHVGEVAVTSEVRDALAHLVVQDLVVLPGVSRRVVVGLRKEALVADFLVGDRDVRYGELHGGIRAEVVVERGEHGEDVLLALLARRLVGDVGELDGLGEEPLLDLGDAVAIDGVVADEGGYVPRGGARPLLARDPLLVRLLAAVGVR